MEQRRRVEKMGSSGYRVIKLAYAFFHKAFSVHNDAKWYLIIHFQPKSRESQKMVK